MKGCPICDNPCRPIELPLNESGKRYQCPKCKNIFKLEFRLFDLGVWIETYRREVERTK